MTLTHKLVGKQNAAVSDCLIDIGMILCILCEIGPKGEKWFQVK